MLDGVQGNASAHQHRRILLRGGPAKHSLDARNHLHHTEGFCQIVVGPQIQPDDLVVLRIFCRCHDYRNVPGQRGSLQLLENGDAVFPRQHDVQQNQFRRFLFHCGPERHAVRETVGGEARRVQSIQHQIPDALIIFHTIYHTETSSCSFSLLLYATILKLQCKEHYHEFVKSV